MIISCKWPPPLGESLGIPYDVICMCAHVFMCMLVHVCRGHPLTTPTNIHPPTHPPGGTLGISQNSIALELIKMFQFRLKIWNLWRLPHPWVGVLLGGWVGGLMGGVRSKHSKFKKSWPNWDNSILFQDLWFVETPPPTPLPSSGCVGGWVGQCVGSGQMTKNLISLDLIEIIQFCLKIYDL